MKFAIISDIHGNLPALEAVLADAERKHVDCYMFAGDYCMGNPFPDACVTRVKGIGNKAVVRGNEEGYLESLEGSAPDYKKGGQMQISCWCYQHTGGQNRRYLRSLPERAVLAYPGFSIHISHSSTAFIADSEHRRWRSSEIAKRYPEGFVTRERLRTDLHDDLKKDGKFAKRLAALADGVYIFGHSHVQWSYRSGNKLLINPGSCGLPLDCIEEGVPYTVLEISDMEHVRLEELRVPFDWEAYIGLFSQSGQFSDVSVWSRIVREQLRTRRELISVFLRYMEQYARKTGDPVRPFSGTAWEQGFACWRAETGLCGGNF